MNSWLKNIKHKTEVKRVKVVDAHAFLVGFSLLRFLAFHSLETIVLKPFVRVKVSLISAEN